MREVERTYSKKTLKQMDNLGVEPAGGLKIEVAGYYGDVESALKGYLRFKELEIVENTDTDLKGVLEELEDIHKTIKKVGRKCSMI